MPIEAAKKRISHCRAKASVFKLTLVMPNSPLSFGRQMTGRLTRFFCWTTRKSKGPWRCVCGLNLGGQIYDTGANSGKVQEIVLRWPSLKAESATQKFFNQLDSMGAVIAVLPGPQPEPLGFGPVQMSARHLLINF